MRQFVALLTALLFICAEPARAIEYQQPAARMVSYTVPMGHPDAMPAKPWDGVQVAQVGFGGMFPGPGTVHSAGGGGYTGPGDIVAVGTNGAFYSVARAYNATKATAAVAAFVLCLGGNLSNCNDIHVTSTGGLNASDTALNSCATSGTCEIKSVYEQSGSGQPNLVFCSTTSNCPIWKPNGVSTGIPAAQASGSTSFSSGSLTSTGGSWTVAMVASVATATVGFNARIFVAPDPTGILCCNTGHWSVHAGSTIDASASITANTFYSVTAGTDSSTGGYICQNNAGCGTGSAGSNSISGVPGAIEQGGGLIGEIMIIAPIINSTVRGNLTTNQRSWYGI